MKNSKKSFGIIGGGVLGMTLALRMREKGFRVSLLEEAPKTGGLASSCRLGEYTWDRFYHVILMSDANTLDLLDRLGLKGEVQWRETKTGFFTEGKLVSMSNLFEFLAFPPLNVLDKLRLGFTILYASKTQAWEKLEEISVSDWLVRLSGKKTFSKIWLPLLKSKLGEYHKITSAAFIWAIIARMYAARRSGLKKEMFGYVPGGYGRIVDSFQGLLDDSGVETHCLTRVTGVEDSPGGVEVHTGSGKTFQFDKVVLTLPVPHVEALCPQLTPQEKERLRSVTYAGVVCAALILKEPLATYYVTNITDESIPFTGVIETTTLVSRDHFGGHSLVYLPRYLTENDPFRNKSDGEITEEFISALEFMYPGFSRDDLVSCTVSRADHVLPITTLRYSKTLLPTTSTSLNNIFMVNSAQIANGTMNVNEIVGLANKKADEVVEIFQNADI